MSKQDIPIALWRMVIIAVVTIVTRASYFQGQAIERLSAEVATVRSENDLLKSRVSTLERELDGKNIRLENCQENLKICIDKR